MGGTTIELKRLALDIVAQRQKCSFYELTGALRGVGASHRAANETVFHLMRDGYLRRTFTGQLVPAR